MISKFIAKWVKGGEWLLCRLSSTSGFPSEQVKPRSCPASFGEVLYLIKVTAEFFYPDKAVSKPRPTGHTGK